MWPKHFDRMIKNIEAMLRFRTTFKPASQQLIKGFYEEMGLITTQTSTAIEANTFTAKETYLF